MEELQQAFNGLADFLGSLKGKVLGRAPAFAGEGSGRDVSFAYTENPLLPASFLQAPANEADRQRFPEETQFMPVSDNNMESYWEFGQSAEPGFEQPTTSQMPLR